MSNATFYPRLKPVWREISAYADKMIKEAFSSRHDRFTDESPYLSGVFFPSKDDYSRGSFQDYEVDAKVRKRVYLYQQSKRLMKNLNIFVTIVKRSDESKYFHSLDKQNIDLPDLPLYNLD